MLIEKTLDIEDLTLISKVYPPSWQWLPSKLMACDSSTHLSYSYTPFRLYKALHHMRRFEVALKRKNKNHSTECESLSTLCALLKHKLMTLSKVILHIHQTACFKSLEVLLTYKEIIATKHNASMPGTDAFVMWLMHLLWSEIYTHRIQYFLQIDKWLWQSHFWSHIF